MKAVRLPAIYRVPFYRLILLPAMVWIVFLFLPAPENVKNIVVFGCACPVGTMGVIVSKKVERIPL